MALELAEELGRERLRRRGVGGRRVDDFELHLALALLAKSLCRSAFEGDLQLDRRLTRHRHRLGVDPLAGQRQRAGRRLRQADAERRRALLLVLLQLAEREGVRGLQLVGADVAAIAVWSVGYRGEVDR